MLDYNIRPGVKLHIIPTNQFKTTQIIINLTAKHEKRTVTYRSLLANILELASTKYPDQSLIAKKTASMFGASFGTDLQKYGQVHCFRYLLRLPNEKYLDTDESLLDTGFDFLNEIIFNPLKSENGFDNAIFEREKNNMIADFRSIKEDRQTYAMQQLVDLYFQNDQAIPSYGELAELEKIANLALMEYHEKMLNEDQVDIFVLGNIDENQVVNKASELAFIAREPKEYDLFYQQDLKNVVEQKVETFSVTQAKYNLAYHFDINRKTNEKYAALVFNALLGATPLSKLFINVREKASLAYYATSNYSPTTQLLTIQTGIDSSKLAQVQEIIFQQISDIQAGIFSDVELERVQKYLINSYEVALDSPRSILNKSILNALLNRDTTQAEWIEKINDVTKKDIVNVAQKLKLQATYLMAGEFDEEN